MIIKRPFQKISNAHIEKIETGYFSLVLLNASCWAFNEENLYEYMNLLFNKAENHNPIEKIFTIIHICSPHIIKTVIKMIKSCFQIKEYKKTKDLLLFGFLLDSFIVEI